MSMVTPVLNKIYVLKCDGCCNHISNTLIQNGKGEKTRTKGSCALPVPGPGVCTGSSQHELSQMPERGGKKPRQPTQQKTPRRNQTEEASFRSSELQPPVYAAHAGSCHPFPTTLPGLRGESGGAPGATPGVPGGTGGTGGTGRARSCCRRGGACSSGAAGSVPGQDRRLPLTAPPPPPSAGGGRARTRGRRRRAPMWREPPALAAPRPRPRGQPRPRQRPRSTASR